MSPDDAKTTLVAIWLEKADEALVSAESELAGRRLAFALNRIYYACFYACTAILQREGKQFARHRSVLGEFNRSYVKTGQVDVEWGGFIEALFRQRQDADYKPQTQLDPDDVAAHLERARRFVLLIRAIVSK